MVNPFLAGIVKGGIVKGGIVKGGIVKGCAALSRKRCRVQGHNASRQGDRIWILVDK